MPTFPRPRLRFLCRAAALPLVAVLAVAAPAAAQRGPVALPAGWSDGYFDKLDAGRTPTAVVAVMQFSGGPLVEEGLRFRMSDILITDLVRSGRFEVVERERLDVVLAEQKLQTDGLTDVSQTALRLGRILNAELVVFGLVTSATHQKLDKFSYDLMRSEVAVDIRAVDASTGRVVISETATGSAEAKVITTAGGTVVSGPTNYEALDVDAARDALDRVARRLADAFPLVGIVAQAQGDVVYLDAGAARGVKAGDTFVVFRRGKEILHPTTRKRLGFEKTIVGTVQVTGAEAELSTAKVVRLNDRAVPVAAGDVVVIQPAPEQR
jgi:curli biogenesis system outer membrane secretion channel CsgG